MADLEISPEVVSVGGSPPSGQEAFQSAEAANQAYRESIQKIRQVREERLNAKLAQMGNLKSVIEGFESIGHKTSLLLASIRKQENLTRDTQAIITYKDRVNHLDEQVANIQDFSARTQIYKSGLFQILDDLKQQYPNLSPLALRTLETEITNDFKQHTIKTVAERNKQALIDINNLQDKSARLISLAKSNSERQLIESNFYKHLQESVGIGTLHQQEADDKWTKFQQDVAKAQFQELVVTNPRLVLSLDPSNIAAKYGITTSEFFQYRMQASKVIDERTDTAFKNFDEERKQAVLYAQQHPEQAAAMARSGKIPLEVGSFITHTHLEQYPENPSFVAHMEHLMQSYTGSEEGYDNLFETQVAPYLHDINPSDRYQILQAHTDSRKELKDDMVQTKNGLKNDLFNKLNTIGTDTGIALIGGPVGKGFSQFSTKLQKNLDVELRGAKTESEMLQIYDKYDKEAEDYLDKIKSPIKPTSKKSDTGDKSIVD